MAGSQVPIFRRGLQALDLIVASGLAAACWLAAIAHARWLELASTAWCGVGPAPGDRLIAHCPACAGAILFTVAALALLGARDARQA